MAIDLTGSWVNIPWGSAVGFDEWGRFVFPLTNMSDRGTRIMAPDVTPIPTSPYGQTTLPTPFPSVPHLSTTLSF